MADHRPLGDYGQLSDWKSHVAEWGVGRAKFGSGAAVIADLVAGIREFPAEVADRYPGKAEAFPLAVGCVPWLTDPSVVDALVALRSAVIVLNKASRNAREVNRLAATNVAPWQGVFPDLEFMAPRNEDGSTVTISPYGGMPTDEQTIGPVRLVGWADHPGLKVQRPLLHAKMLVLCAQWYWDGEFGEETRHLTPLKTWVGSANWTRKSAEHIEFGTWIDDKAFAESALAFLTDVLSFSEPYDSPAPDPNPDLEPVDWDDDAFAEAAAGYEPYDEDDLG